MKQVTQLITRFHLTSLYYYALCNMYQQQINQTENECKYTTRRMVVFLILHFDISKLEFSRQYMFGRYPCVKTDNPFPTGQRPDKK